MTVLFEPVSARSGKLRCTVCSTTGWPTGGKYWMAKCLAGHPFRCPECDRAFPSKQAVGAHRLSHRKET